DVSTLFMIIDTDRSGWIDLDEFVSGCMQLHGPAKSLQLAQMSHENKVTRQVIRSLTKSVASIHKELSALRYSMEDGSGTNHVV
ncbi:CACNA1C, partial [Symbiodinium necroappetens]